MMYLIVFARCLTPGWTCWSNGLARSLFDAQREASIALAKLGSGSDEYKSQDYIAMCKIRDDIGVE